MDDDNAVVSENTSVTLNKSRLEYLWNIYTVIVDWIKFSDTKAAAIIAANGVTVGLVLTNSTTVNTLSNKSAIFPILTGIGGIVLYLSSILCLLSLIPKLSVGEPSSIVFFAHIAKKSKSVQDYRLAINTVFKDNAAENQISDQIWAISKVASRKYFLVGWGLRLFAGMILTSLIFIALAVLLP